MMRHVGKARAAVASFKHYRIGPEHDPDAACGDHPRAIRTSVPYKGSEGKFAQTSSLKFARVAGPIFPVLAAPIARRGALEISDPIVAALSHQCEDSALRVRALGDPFAARH